MDNIENNEKYIINNKTDILSLSKTELKDFIKNNLNFESFRADQIYSWLYANIADFNDMSNIPKTQQKIFDENLYISKLEILKKQTSADGTVKYLFRLHDGNMIESVS